MTNTTEYLTEMNAAMEDLAEGAKARVEELSATTTDIRPGINYPSLMGPAWTYRIANVADDRSTLAIRDTSNGWTDTEFEHARFVPSYSTRRFSYYGVPAGCSVELTGVEGGTGIVVTLLGSDGEPIATSLTNDMVVVFHRSLGGDRFRELRHYYEAKDGGRVFTPSGLL